MVGTHPTGEANMACSEMVYAIRQAGQDWANVGCDFVRDYRDAIKEGRTTEAGAMRANAEDVRHYAHENMDAHCEACRDAWAAETIRLFDAALPGAVRDAGACACTCGSDEMPGDCRSLGCDPDCTICN
jgi:hypothetical protein